MTTCLLGGRHFITYPFKSLGEETLVQTQRRHLDCRASCRPCRQSRPATFVNCHPCSGGLSSDRNVFSPLESLLYLVHNPSSIFLVVTPIKFHCLTKRNICVIVCSLIWCLGDFLSGADKGVCVVSVRERSVV